MQILVFLAFSVFEFKTHRGRRTDRRTDGYCKTLNAACLDGRLSNVMYIYFAAAKIIVFVCWYVAVAII